MVWPRQLWLRLQTLFRPNRSAQRLDDEIQFHLEQQTAENIPTGMSPEEALRRHASLRQRHSVGGRNPRPLGLDLARTLRPRFALWSSHASEESRIHGCGGTNARPGNWRQYGHFSTERCPPPACHSREGAAAT